MPPLPALREFLAPGHWRAIDFISDLHLSEQTPRTYDAWASYLKGTTADAVVMLGDLLEVWVGDDARHGAFESSCVAVLREASSTHRLFFMAGNRDFLLGADMLHASGMQALPDPTVVSAFGQRVLLSHGDELCRADTDYQKFRALVRSAAFQSDFLAKPLVEREAYARQIRNESQVRRRASDADDHSSAQRVVESDADLDREETIAWMDAASAAVFVHGHTHRPADELVSPGHLRHVLTDWDLDTDVPGAARAEVLRWTASGMVRIAPAAAMARMA